MGINRGKDNGAEKGKKTLEILFGKFEFAEGSAKQKKSLSSQEMSDLSFNLDHSVFFQVIDQKKEAAAKIR
jgi:hypothetical protein